MAFDFTGSQNQQRPKMKMASQGAQKPAGGLLGNKMTPAKPQQPGQAQKKLGGSEYGSPPPSAGAPGPSSGVGTNESDLLARRQRSEQMVNSGDWLKDDYEYKSPAEWDALLAQARAQDEAESFRSTLGDTTESQFRGLLPEYAEAQETGKRGIKEGYAERGLLYSGMQSGAQKDLRGQLAQSLSQSRASIQREGEQVARAKEEAAAAGNMQLAQQMQARAEDLYNISAANQVARIKSFGRIAQGAGYAAGYAYGKGPKNTENVSGSGGGYGPYDPSSGPYMGQDPSWWDE